MVSFDETWGVNLISWFLCVVTFGVPFPFDEVLEPSGPSVASMIDDTFHFVFFFPADKVRWWPGEVRPMC
jgi:hypothetical protein